MYLYDVENWGLLDGDWVKFVSWLGEIILCVQIIDCVSLGVVYIIFYYFDIQVNVIIMDFSDWVMNCFEYKVIVVQVSLLNGLIDW